MSCVLFSRAGGGIVVRTSVTDFASARFSLDDGISLRVEPISAG